MEQEIKLLREAIRRRGMAYKTEKSYVQWIIRFFRFIGKKEHINRDDIVNYLNHLACTRGVASSTQNQALCAIVLRLLIPVDQKIKKLLWEVMDTLEAVEPKAFIVMMLSW